MRIIQELSSQIEEEIEDAKNYAKHALTVKEGHPELGQTYQKLADSELDHVNRLHDAVTILIKEYRAKNGDPPANMMAVYEYLHGRHIEKVADVKAMLDMFKR